MANLIPVLELTSDDVQLEYIQLLISTAPWAAKAHWAGPRLLLHFIRTGIVELP